MSNPKGPNRGLHGYLPHVGFNNRIFRPDILQQAWKEVRVNKGSVEADGITFEIIKEYGVEEYLLDIQENLRNKECRSKPVESYGKSSSGATWFDLEDSLRASSESQIY